MSKQGAKAGTVAGSAAGWYAGATAGAEAGSIAGPVGSLIGSVIGAAVGSLFGGSGPDKLGPKKRAAFLAAGGVIRRGRYYVGAERVGIRGARRVAAAGSTNVLQFPKTPKKRPPSPPPPPRQPGAVATGVGVGAGAAAAQAVLQSLPPVAQWVWNEAQQRWEWRNKDVRKGPARRYRRKTREELISENIRRQIAEIRRKEANAGKWTGRVTLPPVGGVSVIARQDAAIERIVARSQEPLEQIKVTAKRLPVPAPVQLPAGYRIFRAATRAIGIPGAARYYNLLKPLAPLALLNAKSLLQSDKKPKRGKQIQEQLTALQQQGLGYQPSYSSYTALAPMAAAQPATAKRCKPCPKPKKRGKRKPRTICYRGTFTERRNGLSKSRREQVPCR